MRVQKIDLLSEFAGAELSESLRNTGFAVITNHDIDSKLLQRVYSEWSNYFRGEDKFDHLGKPDHSGYFPLGSENAKGYSVKDLKEFFHIYHGSDVPTELSPKTSKLKSQLTACAESLLSLLNNELPSDIRNGLSQGLPQMIRGSAQTLLRILHYPPMPSDAEPGAVRAAAHEDINLITLLPCASAPGLQVRDLEGNWHEVECDPGSIIVNSGDMLDLATGGFFPSTSHRVVNPIGPTANVSRYSIPLFLHPRPDVQLSPTKTAGQFLAERIAEIMGEK